MPLLPLTLLSLAAQAVGGASEEIYRWEGAVHFDAFGSAVADARDVDGDGIKDLLIGTPWTDSGSLVFSGTAQVYSGTDGSLLYQWDGQYDHGHFGGAVAGAGDVNGDGFADVIIGEEESTQGGLLEAGAAYVYSGADGSLLFQWSGTVAGGRFGESVAGAGDVNADGFDDLIVGTPYADVGGIVGAGLVHVYSGQNGALLYQWNGTVAGDSFGWRVSHAGDVNADGYDDILFSASPAPAGIPSAGAAFVHSGFDGSLLYRWDGAAVGDSFGKSVADAGDIDGDGFDDVLIGAWGTVRGGVSGVGSAYLFSGFDGSQIYTWDGKRENDGFGEEVSGIGDADGDGIRDVVVSASMASDGQYEFGTVYLHSGADGSLVHQIHGEAGGDRFGDSIAGVADLDGDGLNDILIGASQADGAAGVGSGIAYAYGFHPFLFADTRSSPQPLGARSLSTWISRTPPDCGSTGSFSRAQAKGRPPSEWISPYLRTSEPSIAISGTTPSPPPPTSRARSIAPVMRRQTSPRPPGFPVA